MGLRYRAFGAQELRYKQKLASEHQFVMPNLVNKLIPVTISSSSQGKRKIVPVEISDSKCRKDKSKGNSFEFEITQDSLSN